MNVFNGNWDGKENSYLNCYSNIETNAVICDKNINTVFKGNPKIVVRKGKSTFGNEMLFQFLIKKEVEQYPANSDYKVIEYYLPLEEGVEFLKNSIKFIEGKLNEVEGSGNEKL